MSIFSAIKNAIFGAPEAAATPSPVAAPAAAAVAAAPAAPVDVDAILTAAAASVDYETNWRTSIVDLMKLCGLDSSLTNRKQLATELGYTGDMNDSASMNIWLHRQVMNQLAANGGFVPADLKD
jgi:Domain of unknown function (DUF3597)